MTEDIKIQTEFIKFRAEYPNSVNVDNLPRKWVAAAKNGQVVNVKDKICVVTAEALKSSLGTWKDGKIFDNHETQISGFKIYGDKYEDPFLYFELDEQTIKNLGEGEGGSIDSIATKIENQKILEMTGIGYSILRPGIIPSCPKEAGCGIAGEGAAEEGGSNVNIGGGIPNPNIKVDKMGDGKNPDPNKIDKDQEEYKKKMADEKGEKPEVSFSEDQVATMKAEAVKTVGEQMTATHKVEISDLEKVHAAELKTLGETHATEMATQRDEVTKHVEMVESLSTKFALSPEAKKTLVDAKTPEDVYTLLETLKVEKAEPVIAAKGGAETGCGIILGSEIEGKAPESIKIEEVGTYNPFTGKYEATYREEQK
jgi:hypothetical protein